MSYQVHNFQSGDVLLASQLNEMDNQIAENSKEIDALACGTIVDVSTKVNGELSSANIVQAILDALNDSSYIYIPAGDYTFNVAISTDCTILLDDECYISTATKTPCISASNCSISIYGGNIYSGEDVDYSTLTANDDRRKPLGWGTSIQRGEQSIIRLMNCHDCTIKGVSSPWHNSLFAIFASSCRSLVIESCSFDKILRSAVFLDGHCEKVAIRNCVFKNSRYALDSSGNPQYWCYFVYTGVWSNSDLVTPPDGLIFENNYCEHSEDCGLDTHGASNVIMRNNTVLDTVCALTAYNDNARIKRPSGWTMDNVLLENNYCYTTKSNNPGTNYPHPFIFLGASNDHSATEQDWSDNPGSYEAFRNCVVRNNTFICYGAHDGSVKSYDLFALSFDCCAKNVTVVGNTFDIAYETYAAIGSFDYLLFARIEDNTFLKQTKVDFRNGSSVKIDYGAVSIRDDVLREITWTNGLGRNAGNVQGTVICCGNPLYLDDSHMIPAVGYGKRLTSNYTGTRSFTVNVTDGVCTLVKHALIPGMRAVFTAQGSSTPIVKYIESLIDFDRFETFNNSSSPALSANTYTMVLSDTTYETYINKNQGVANAGKFMVVGNDGVVVPVTMAVWQGGNY